jgi:hypothetical protein
MRNCVSALILVSLQLVGGIARAACLTTLGMDDCFRAGDPVVVQAVEHHYLDAPTRDQAHSRSKRRHLHAKKPSAS